MRLITISILKFVHGTIYTPWSEWLSAGGQEKCYDTGFEVRSRECKIGKSLKMRYVTVICFDGGTNVPYGPYLSLFHTL